MLMMKENDPRCLENYTILDEGENFRVKTIEVAPGKPLNYQSRRRRPKH